MIIMKKCCFIIPYFGKLPNYFELFCKSCQYNPSFNWLIITDDYSKYNIPQNMHIVYMKFSELKDLVQSKFDFPISLSTPYKLCDYKPAYGYIFEDYLKDYKYWGHCDLDTIMGDLDSKLSLDFIKSYDKLFCLGHMILYKNDYEINRLFMKPVRGEYWYKNAFQNEKITIFDETYNNTKNINEIFKYYKKSILEEDWSLNLKVIPTRFIKTTFDCKTKSFIDDNKKSLITWEKGKIKRYYIEDNKLIKQEYLYIHLQERKMTVHKLVTNLDRFKIIPNSFLPLELDVNLNNFKKIKKRKLCFHYLQFKIKWQKKKWKRIISEIKRKRNCQ